MSNNRFAPVCGVLVVFIVIFNLIAFITASDYSANFWSGYAFITLSWLCLVFVLMSTVRRKDHEGYGLFLSAPIITISLVYLLFELITGVLVMVIPDFNLTASIVIQVLIFGIYLIVIFGLSFYKGMATQKLSERSGDTAFKKSLVMQIENAKNRCKNPALKQKLVEMYDLLKYSDPVSSQATTDCEARIMELFPQITADLYQKEKSTTLALCDEIAVLINQRNALCAANKKH